MENKLNVNKLMEVLSEILSKKYGCKITMTAIPKEEYYKNHPEEAKKLEEQKANQPA